MKNGGHADLVIPIDIVDEVALFLHRVVQRGDIYLSLEQIKNENFQSYQLDTRNDWTLFVLPDSNVDYRLGARYESQQLVDSIATIVR